MTFIRYPDGPVLSHSQLRLNQGIDMKIGRTRSDHGHRLWQSLAICIPLLMSCATQPKQSIDGVCVEVVGLAQHESAFILKRTASYLREYGLPQMGSDCAVSVRYQAFGGLQAELVGGLVKKGYSSQEGNVTVKHGGRTIVDDEAILLRGYDSRQAVLDATAWEMIKPVTKAFRPPTLKP